MKFIKYEQNNQLFISTVLTFKEIFLNSKVVIYGSKNDDGTGYQRPLQKPHMNKIIKYVKEVPDSFIFPTPIILAINSEHIENIFHNDSNWFKESHDNKLFRIVDGQHRIFAIAEIIKDEKADITLRKKLLNFNFNVVILEISSDQLTTEMDVFIDINSKSKRLQTDLINLAKYRVMKILNLDNATKYEDCVHFVCMQAAYLLNNNKPEIEVNKLINPWHHGVKFEIEDRSVGIISVSAFIQSITPITKLKLSKKNINHKSIDLIKYLEIIAIDVAKILLDAWGIVIDKWSGCFKIGGLGIYYNSGYYLQKTMGTSAVHQVLQEVITISKEDWNEEFSNFIKYSVLTEDDWLSPGKFSGYTSESGFKKIAAIIKQDYEQLKSLK